MIYMNDDLKALLATKDKEIEELKAELKDVKVHSIEIEKGNVDFKLSGQNAKIFIDSLVQFFKQNGGKNYLTTTVANNKEKYEITVKNCYGEKSVAEDLQALKSKLTRMNIIAKQLDNHLYENQDKGYIYTAVQKIKTLSE